MNYLRNNSWKISEENIEKGLLNVVKNTKLKGRWQTISENPKIVCDTGHNIAGISYVIEQISKQDFKNLHLVLGFVKDKDVDAVLSLFPKNAFYYFCKPNIPRGLDAEIVKEIAQQKGLNGNVFGSVEDALESAKQNAQSSDFIFVGGSTFVVAEIVP